MKTLAVALSTLALIAMLVASPKIGAGLGFVFASVGAFIYIISNLSTNKE